MKQPFCEMAENFNHFLKLLVSKYGCNIYNSGVTHFSFNNIYFPGRHIEQKY